MLEVFVHNTMFPDGIFKTLCELWNTFRITFLGVLEFFVTYSVDLSLVGLGNVSLMTLMIGGGLLWFIIFKFFAKLGK